MFTRELEVLFENVYIPVSNYDAINLCLPKQVNSLLNDKNIE